MARDVDGVLLRRNFWSDNLVVLPILKYTRGMAVQIFDLDRKKPQIIGQCQITKSKFLPIPRKIFHYVKYVLPVAVFNYLAAQMAREH